MIDAYLRGLSARADAGEPVDTITSVASFFLSRIDTKADALLDAGSPARGQVALASARVAYQRYRAKFASPGWERLRDLGARPQRPLWASTGTKNPGLFRRALRRGADRPRRDQHDARADAAGVRRPRHGRAHGRRQPR